MVFNMIIADSSFLVALFLKEDVNHGKAVELFKKQGEFLVLDYALGETMTVIVYKRGIDFAKEAYDKIKANEAFDVHQISQDDIEHSYEFLFSRKKKLSFVDSIIIHFAVSRKMDIAAFDRQIGSVFRKVKKKIK